MRLEYNDFGSRADPSKIDQSGFFWRGARFAVLQECRGIVPTKV
jgi:hypothetical protein